MSGIPSRLLCDFLSVHSINVDVEFTQGVGIIIECIYIYIYLYIFLFDSTMAGLENFFQFPIPKFQ